MNSFNSDHTPECLCIKNEIDLICSIKKLRLRPSTGTTTKIGLLTEVRGIHCQDCQCTANQQQKSMLCSHAAFSPFVPSQGNSMFLQRNGELCLLQKPTQINLFLTVSLHIKVYVPIYTEKPGISSLCAAQMFCEWELETKIKNKTKQYQI